MTSLEPIEEMEVSVQSELDLALSNALQESLDSRPQNTLKMYQKRQHEFSSWCKSIKKFSDGDFVTEAKILLYLNEVIIPRGNTRKMGPDNKPLPLSKEGVEAYVKSIIDLYKYQITMKHIIPATYPHPRGAALSAKMVCNIIIILLIFYSFNTAIYSFKMDYD